MMKQTVLRGMMGFPCRELPEPHRVWEEALAADTATRRTLYIHIPYCRSRCPFCPFYLGGAGEEETAEYVRLLRLELERWGELAGRFPVNAVYFGGGTPSDLGAESLVSLLDAVRKNYRLAADCEITVEGRIDGFEPEKARPAGRTRREPALDRNPDLRHGTAAQARAGFGPAARFSGGSKRWRRSMNFRWSSICSTPCRGRRQPGGRRILRRCLPRPGFRGWTSTGLKFRTPCRLRPAIRAGKLPPVPDGETAYAMHLAGVEAMRSAGAGADFSGPLRVRCAGAESE